MINTKSNKGFTIIEVVLVLAIAGLIFLMVFIALPALQRGQRDNQRRNDVARFRTQINSYATNNRGAIPPESQLAGFMDSYMKRNQGEFKDPKTGNDYQVAFGADRQNQASTEKMVYATGAKCNGESIQAISGSPRSFAVRVQLEGSGFHCEDNQ